MRYLSTYNKDEFTDEDYQILAERFKIPNVTKDMIANLDMSSYLEVEQYFKENNLEPLKDRYGIKNIIDQLTERVTRTLGLPEQYFKKII